MAEGLLDEFLVVDLSRGVAGAYCCLLFAHLGAEVVRVETPAIEGGRTEVLPYISPHIFPDINAGKKSVTLDLSEPEGGDVLLRLAGHADVLVIDSSLPGGLDYRALSRQNPRLLLTHITSSDGDDLFAQYFTGLNAFAAATLPLVKMSILGRGQEINVDAAECVAAAAFAVDALGEWPSSTDSPTPPPPFRLTGLTALSPLPQTGEHNDEVYCGLLGLSGEELARLKEAGVV